jgi:hypothetical protein
MIISLPIRIRARRFEFRPKARLKKVEPIDFADYEASRPNGAFRSGDCSPLIADAFPLSLTEISTLVSPSQPRGALWINRPPSQGQFEADDSAKLAVWRLRTCGDPPRRDFHGDSVLFDVLLFEMPDWRRHAACLIQNVGDLSVFESTRESVASAAPLRNLCTTFDIPQMTLPRVRDCPSASFIILESLATGAQAVFGRESFSDERQFVEACAYAIAMLPPLQRGRISLAAGFTRPLPHVRVQWIDARVSAPPGGKLAAMISALPAETATAAVCDHVSREIDAIGRSPACSPRDSARRNSVGHTGPADLPATICMTMSTDRCGADLRQQMASLATAVECASHGNTAIPRDAAQGAAIFVDRYSSRDVDDLEGELARSRFGRSLARLRAQERFPVGDPASITDSIEVVEELLAVVKLVANGHRWTDGLTALARAAIAALRKIVLDKPNDDRDVAACFLRSISCAPYCYHTIAAWLAADDPRGRASVENAIAATGQISQSLNLIRQDAERHLLAYPSSVMTRTTQQSAQCLAFRSRNGDLSSRSYR